MPTSEPVSAGSDRPAHERLAPARALILNNQGAGELDPMIFRRAAEARQLVVLSSNGHEAEEGTR